MYAISRVYAEEQPVTVQRRAQLPSSHTVHLRPVPPTPQRAPLPPSGHVQLRPVPPTPHRAPQTPVQDQSIHRQGCACDACQPTFPMQKPRQTAQNPHTQAQQNSFSYEPFQTPRPLAGAEQDLRTLLVPTILQRLRASIEAHPLIWLGVSYVLNLF